MIRQLAHATPVLSAKHIGLQRCSTWNCVCWLWVCQTKPMLAKVGAKTTDKKQGCHILLTPPTPPPTFCWEIFSFSVWMSLGVCVCVCLGEVGVEEVKRADQGKRRGVGVGSGIWKYRPDFCLKGHWQRFLSPVFFREICFKRILTWHFLGSRVFLSKNNFLIQRPYRRFEERFLILTVFNGAS